MIATERDYDSERVLHTLGHSRPATLRSGVHERLTNEPGRRLRTGFGV
jgi:hypothetical protein